jgi:hypothetical protein
MAMMLKGFKHLRTSFAGFFYSAPGIILVFFSIIIENVITLTLSFGSA